MYIYMQIFCLKHSSAFCAGCALDSDSTIYSRSLIVRARKRQAGTASGGAPDDRPVVVGERLRLHTHIQVVENA